MINAAGWASVGHKETLCSFYCYLCSAIRLREVGRGHAMSYSPETEEGLCTTCSEFWATITGKFFRYAKRGEEGSEVANEASSACKGCACWGTKHLYPARKAVT